VHTAVGEKGTGGSPIYHEIKLPVGAGGDADRDRGFTASLTLSWGKENKILRCRQREARGRGEKMIMLSMKKAKRKGGVSSLLIKNLSLKRSEAERMTGAGAHKT